VAESPARLEPIAIWLRDPGVGGATRVRVDLFDHVLDPNADAIHQRIDRRGFELVSVVSHSMTFAHPDR
jgi:hypothetical protein